jgi:hypothetical protein
MRIFAALDPWFLCCINALPPLHVFGESVSQHCKQGQRPWEFSKAVSVQGINVFRFANRIPLLFEAGGDVITRTASKRIK